MSNYDNILKIGIDESGFIIKKIIEKLTGKMTILHSIKHNLTFATKSDLYYNFYVYIENNKITEAYSISMTFFNNNNYVPVLCNGILDKKELLNLITYTLTSECRKNKISSLFN